MMKNLLYLFYHLKKLDRRKYKKFLRYASKETGRSATGLQGDMIQAVLKNKISILEYFQFGFYKLSSEERKKYAGTGYMYEYQLLMNPKEERKVLSDKRIFLKQFAAFVKHQHIAKEDIISDDNRAFVLLQNKSGKVVLKSHDGQCGYGVEVIESESYDVRKLVDKMNSSHTDLAEEYIVQHPDLMKLSPSGLNTVRIFTQLAKDDTVNIIGCRLRISVNSVVDNMAAGNMAAVIDESTGIVSGPGVYSDITKPDEEIHPVTGVPIIGFQIPYWSETVDMVKKAALTIPECRSIGWDIAITEKGPELVEGNHDWCKLVWQLPVKKGLKPVLEKYKKEMFS